MVTMRQLPAIRTIVSLGCLLVPLAEVGANTIKGNVKDVNGNQPSGTDGYTIQVVYNDGVTQTINYPSAGISQISAFTLSVGPAMGSDKTVKITFTRSANPADVRVVNGVISNDVGAQVIDINFAGTWGSTKDILTPPSPRACGESQTSCGNAGRGRLLLRGRHCCR